MSLSFINFIENTEIKENIEVKNDSDKFEVTTTDEYYKSNEPIFEKSILHILNPNAIILKKDDDIESKERVIQSLELDIIYLDSVSNTILTEENLLSKIFYFFQKTENETINNFINLSLKILNKYCIMRLIQYLNSFKYKNKMKLKKKFSLKNHLILYTICISYLKRDLRIHVIDINGDIKFMCSVRTSIDFHYRRVKRLKTKLVKDLLKFFLNQSFLYFLKEDEDEDEENLTITKNKSDFLIPVGVLFKNIPQKYLRRIIKKLKARFYITTINMSLDKSYNGCRPKKLRRVKQRKRKQYKSYSTKIQFNYKRQFV